MMYDCKGRYVNSVEEAEDFIREFIAQSRSNSSDRSAHRSHDYDLYIPWLIEVVENLPAERAGEPASTLVLERIYMEAAWSLCLKGLMRPGPQKASSANAGDPYGKGYSLTLKGDRWLSQAVVGVDARRAESLGIA